MWLSSWLHMYNNSFVNRYERLPFVPIHGGESSIHLALDTKTNEQVIVKKYHFEEGIPESAINEIFILSQREIRSSPYIVQLISYYEHNEQRILVLEKCECDLAGKLEMSVEERMSAMKELAYALETLHSLNHAHRDVKPANLLVSSQHTLKLCDFGLSGRYDRPGGTREYQPPEVFINGELSGKYSDIWSFGITWLELICGAERGGFWHSFTRYFEPAGDAEEEFLDSCTSAFKGTTDESEVLSDKEILYLIERLIGSANCELCVNGSCTPCLGQFLQEIRAGPIEGLIIKQCLQWEPSSRITIQQILQGMDAVELVPLFPSEHVKRSEKNTILLDCDEAPLACLFDSVDQECRDNFNVSGLDACALEWSMQGDLGEEGL